ncbi:serine/threonine-protein kinase [Actinoplanes sp. NPDC051851]|uniref:serine/threonine-protein kinase n=1 Tax=Actinoplanes sp. NPDC051851 TaxID=3154753 RepID=UPI003425DFF6
MHEVWPAPGVLLTSRYRLVSLLETGGMAQVWQATDELLDRPVAVKLPAGDTQAAHLAWREARLAAKLSHPGIAAVHDYREAVRTDGSVAPFVVMELLDGETVAARLCDGPLPWPAAAAVGAAVAGALAAAHAAGVVHRDIKPGNVMLCKGGVKLLDFGISAAAGEPDEDDTGATFGTPAYAAPERLDGMPAEPATDLYGLGVLLFEMVAGVPPYDVNTWEELAAARVIGPTPLPAGVPVALRQLIARCLADDPARRPVAAEVWKVLAELTPGEEAGAPTVPLPGARPTGTSRVPTLGQPRRVSKVRPFLVGIGLGTVAIAFLAAVNLVSQPDESALRTPVATIPTANPLTTVDRDPVDPTTEATTSSPSPSPTATVTVTATPTAELTAQTRTVLTVDAALRRVRTAVDQGAASGDIRSDVALDFQNILRQLALTEDTADITGQVALLQQKVRQRVDEGGIAEGTADLLQARLTDLSQAAGA